MPVFHSVSIIIPAINETDSLSRTVDIVYDTCSKEDIAEIIIVLCDRTTQACVKTAENIQVKYRLYPIRIYYQKEPFIGAAYKEAFMIAAGSHILIMSADMETDPIEVQEFIAQQKQYPDSVILGSRWMKGGRFQGYHKIKLILNLIFQQMLSVLFLTRMSDMTLGYKSFPAPLVRSINWVEKKHPIFLEMALKPLRLGVEMREIPCSWKPRLQGESQNSFFSNFRYFKTAFSNRFIKKSQILLPEFSFNRQNDTGK